jgi:hypothetical protein
VTEQGLGHDCGGLSDGVKVCPEPRTTVGAGGGETRVTGLDTQVNGKHAYSPCWRSVVFVTLW